MYLGIKAVIAKSFERIHRDNLANFGIVPLQFTDQADYETIKQDGQIVLEDIRTQLANGTEVIAKLDDGSPITLKHNLSAKELDMVLAGGRLNMFK